MRTSMTASRTRRAGWLRTWRKTSPRDQRGSFSLEIALITPIALVLIGLAIYAGRVALASQSIEQAAEAAAREASIARTVEGARTNAREAATRAIAEQDLDCLRVDVSVDTSGFRAALGQPANVEVTVACTVRTSDLAIPGAPGSRKVSATAASPLDAYRERR